MSTRKIANRPAIAAIRTARPRRIRPQAMQWRHSKRDNHYYHGGYPRYQSQPHYRGRPGGAGDLTTPGGNRVLRRMLMRSGLDLRRAAFMLRA